MPPVSPTAEPDHARAAGRPVTRRVARRVIPNLSKPQPEERTMTNTQLLSNKAELVLAEQALRSFRDAGYQIGDAVA